MENRVRPQIEVSELHQPIHPELCLKVVFKTITCIQLYNRHKLVVKLKLLQDQGKSEP